MTFLSYLNELIKVRLLQFQKRIDSIKAQNIYYINLFLLPNMINGCSDYYVKKAHFFLYSKNIDRV